MTMNENVLRNRLLKNLQNGEVSKVYPVRDTMQTRYGKEIGNSSFRADILITFDTDAGFNEKKSRFVAIEVKIKDWKQGFYQALRYKSFADRSYLALFEDYAEGVDLELFKQYNVGLIIFNRNDIVVRNRPHIDTVYRRPHSPKLREHLWHQVT